MKADSASHLIRGPISFELFLFIYLIFALLLQKTNIYKTNFHRVDLNLVVFIIVILSRRLTWCILQRLQSHWRPKPPMKGGTWQGARSRSSKGGWGIGGGGWDVLLWNWSLNVKRCIIILCTIPAVVWSVTRLIQNTPLFNLLFLFYPLLLYFSLFGFTLEPRCNRERFEPPKTFLHHIDFTSPSRKSSSPHFCSSSSSNPPRKTDQDSSIHSSASSSSSSSSSSSVHSVSPLHHSGIHNKPHMSANSGSVGTHPNGPTLYHRHKDHSHSSDTLGKVNNVISNIRRLKPQISQNHVGLQKDKSGSNAVPSVTGIRWNEGVRRYSPEYSLLLRCTPDEVRNEVDLLLSDLVVRLKQLLFNSLLCAYYVGFIPMQFADSHLYYDKWWCVEHAFLVWANSFVILSSHLLPPSYCQILYQCSLHLGCWSRVGHDENAKIWSPDVVWVHDVTVQWNGKESFKAEGPQSVAIPCHSSQEFFYTLFNSRLHIHNWLLTMQCITVAFQIVVLLRTVFWFQILSMSIFLVFNYFILYKLLYNRLSRNPLS